MILYIFNLTYHFSYVIYYPSDWHVAANIIDYLG